MLKIKTRKAMFRNREGTYYGINGISYGEDGEVDVNGSASSFTEATSRSNINTGDSYATILGKIKKYLSDIKNGAFYDVANNLTTEDETSGYVLDARQGKELNDKIGAYSASNATVTTLVKNSSVSGGTFGENRVAKMGNVVNVCGRIAGISITPNTSVFVIPEGYRPVTTVYASCFMVIDNVFVPFVASISSSGVVTVGYSATKTMTQFGFVATYPVVI